LAKRRVRQRGADAGGPDEHELEAREREAEDRTAAISELLVTRSDELLDATAHAAELRLPRPGPSRPGPSSDDLPSPSIVGMAGVPPRLLSETAVDISPSTGGFSTPIPSSLSPVDGHAPDLLSTSVGAPTEPPRSLLLGTDGGMVNTPYSPALPDTPLPGVANSTSSPSYPAAPADGPLPGTVDGTPGGTNSMLTHEASIYTLISFSRLPASVMTTLVSIKCASTPPNRLYIYILKAALCINVSACIFGGGSPCSVLGWGCIVRLVCCRADFTCLYQNLHPVRAKVRHLPGPTPLAPCCAELGAWAQPLNKVSEKRRRCDLKSCPRRCTCTPPLRSRLHTRAQTPRCKVSNACWDIVLLGSTTDVYI
jgi:hypothetical protein